MLLLVRLAWRNLFRNKRRTIIAGSAIGLGLAALILTDAIIAGMERNMVKAATSSFLGEGQIHRVGFRETRDVEKTVNDLDRVLAELEKEEIVHCASPRVMATGMLSSPANLGSVVMVGVDPSKEKMLSQIDDVMVKGDYFTGADERNIVMGEKLAEILEVDIGDRVVLTTSAAGGDLSEELFRVSGIFNLGVKEVDNGIVLIRLPKAQAMLGIDGVHEIAVKFDRPERGRDRSLPFWRKYSQGGNEALGWNDILPELEAAFELSDFSVFITGLILFGVVSLGIVNTLFMSLHERMFEFGVLRAVGTRPYRVAVLVVFEGASLALLSVALGMILGFVVSWIVSRTGIDYRGIELSGVTFTELLYPVLKVEQFVKYPIAVFLFTSLVALYPAWYAAKLIPADALRRSL